MKSFRVVLWATVLLAACAPAAPPTPPAPAPGGSCNAAAAQFAVGQTHGEALADQVRRRSGARTSRLIQPGMAVTQEYSSERVNIEVDGSNRVVRVRCG